ncbi:hypothetical protein A3218_01890 [Pseudomonas chlororaphis]|uniref:hypothetical protein n=1 Tax=Pseudomonas chlororaphis TaxID=587753 RepID=UPI000789D18F|nr:hypothetical protein [Pseudomonas chlororaphis]AMS13128.1 hypothetical protein A3218_01890 [Pseudomonas chlororaphis]
MIQFLSVFWGKYFIESMEEKYFQSEIRRFFNNFYSGANRKLQPASLTQLKREQCVWIEMGSIRMIKERALAHVHAALRAHCQANF